MFEFTSRLYLHMGINSTESKAADQLQRMVWSTAGAEVFVGLVSTQVLFNSVSECPQVPAFSLDFPI